MGGYLYEFTKHLRCDRSHLQNRLTEFYNGDARGQYLTRPPQQFAGYEARYQHLVYDLAPRARHALAERGIRACPASRADPFLHRLMSACVMASIELTARDIGLRYISYDEILARPECAAARQTPNSLAIPLRDPDRATLIPDGVFGLQYSGTRYRFFAVGVDRNTESLERTNLARSSFGRKVTGYVALLKDQAYRSCWGLPNLHVLTLTTNEVHANNILTFIRRKAPIRYQQVFAVAAEPQVGAHWRVPRKVLSRLLKEPWRTPAGQKNIGAV